MRNGTQNIVIHYQKNKLITSKQIINQIEQYSDSKNVKGQLVTIYENPTLDEFKDLERSSRQSGGGNVLRCIANAKTQTVYVWDAYNARHVDIRSLLHFPTDFESTPYIIDAYLDVSGGHARMFAWEDIQFYIAAYKNKKSKKLDQYFLQVFGYKWTWLDRYADCSRFIFQQQLDFEDKMFS